MTSQTHPSRADVASPSKTDATDIELQAAMTSQPLVYDPPALVPRVVRRWWAIVGATLLVAVASWFYCTSQTPQYEATAQVQLGEGLAEVVVGQGVLPSVDPDRQLATQLDVIRSERVHLNAEGIAGRKLPDVLVSQASSSSNLIDVGVLEADPEVAALAANAYVTAYLNANRKDLLDQLTPVIEAARKSLASTQAGISDLQDMLEAKPTGAGRRPGVTGLQAQLNGLLSQRQTEQVNLDRLLGARNLSGIDSQDFATADKPDSAALPQTRRTVVLAAGVAFVIASIAAAAVPLRRRRGAA